MTALPDLSQAAPKGPRPASWFTRLVADPAFQARMARIPLIRRLVRREGQAMFDLVAGFCHAQVLQAFVQFGLPAQLLDNERTADDLAQAHRVPLSRMQVLLQAATALGLTKQRRSGHYALTTRGAALAGVPGLQGMIAHHDVLYRDLSDPVAFFRGEVETELATFWPYVFGAGGATDPDITARYSALMADSQALVAADTIASVSWSGTEHVMDIGGGTGAFLAALGQAQPHLDLTLFDLPAVVPAAQDRFSSAGLTAQIVPGSFRDDPLPVGADTITLVRVLYDHADETVRDLLASVYAALPVGGRLVVSEPMTGGAAPNRAGDAYFALYCMAMRTGRARSQRQIATLLSEAGFGAISQPASQRPYVTSIVSGVKFG